MTPSHTGYRYRVQVHLLCDITSIFDPQIKVHLIGSNDLCIPRNWTNMEAALATVYLNRVTGSLVCPQVGSWSEFEALVQACLTNRTRKQGEMTVDYPVLQRV